jgi:hypothetical protein
MDSQRIIERAWRAYIASDGIGAEQPDSLSGVESVNGLAYAVLRNGPRIIAVYRWTNRKKLKRLKRPPSELFRDNRSAPARHRSSRPKDIASLEINK